MGGFAVHVICVGPVAALLSYHAAMQLVCKHWRAALATLPWRFPSLSISPWWPGAGWNPAPDAEAAAAAALSKALGRTHALITRAPTASHVEVQVGSPQLV